MKMTKTFCFVIMAICVFGGCGSNAKEADLKRNSGYEESSVVAVAKETLPREQEKSRAEAEETPTEEVQETPVFELTEKGKTFLEEMCKILPEFSGEADINEDFWNDFIFYGYTATDGDYVNVYREGLGFEEMERKVSAEEVSDYAMLALGRELPDFKPAFGDMGETQTALYYDDGYYYIGVSDFPAFGYVYENCEVYEENEDICADVIYRVDFEDEENVGTVTLHVIPEDNENGFVIVSKVTDIKN